MHLPIMNVKQNTHTYLPPDTHALQAVSVVPLALLVLRRSTHSGQVIPEDF